MKILSAKNAFWPFLLALLTVISYVVLSTSVVLNQRVPFLWLALLLIAVVWSVSLVRARRSVLRFAGVFGTVGLAALFSWWTLGYSEYESREAAADEGEVVTELAEMSLRDHAGLERPVLADGGATLLVLYRGHW
jgi:hypothetical protein